MHSITNLNGLDTVEIALFYASKGFAVGPIKAGTKEPLVSGRRFTKDPERIKYWFGDEFKGSGIGIATGLLSGVLVIDIDNKNGKDGTLALEQLTAKYGDLPPTLVNKTPNGFRLVFSYPGTENIPNSQTLLGKALGLNGNAAMCGLDIATNGSYMLAYPTMVDGTQYTWEGIESIADLPSWFLQLLGVEVGEDIVVKPAYTNGKIKLPEKVGEGTRNVTLFTFASSLRGYGFGAEEILASLIVVNRQRCNPPLPETDLQNIVSQVTNYDPNRSLAIVPVPTNGDYPLTDLGNAERLIATHGKDLRFLGDGGGWYVWNGRVWRRDETQEIVRKAKQTIRGMYAQAATLPEGREEYRDKLIKWARYSERAEILFRAIKLAESETGIPIERDQFDNSSPGNENAWRFNTLSGVIDLRTGELKPHDREHYITQIAPVMYDPNATCPQWNAFLDRIFSGNTELINFLQTMVGYFLTGSSRERQFFIFSGTGDNGKSVFQEIIALLMGEYACKMRSSTLISRQNEQHPAELATLKGKRYAACSETAENARLGEALIKELTGNERINARLMRENPFNFYPTHKLALSTNHQPYISSDPAVWARICLIPFEVKIPLEQQDKGLTDKLADELPGILLWAIEGAKRYFSSGLNKPSKVMYAVKQYREELDVLARFFSDTCQMQGSVKGTALYERYKIWAATQGERQISAIAFGKKLKERGIEKTIDGYGAVMYNGISLKTLEPSFKVKGLSNGN